VRAKRTRFRGDVELNDKDARRRLHAPLSRWFILYDERQDASGRWRQAGQRVWAQRIEDDRRRLLLALAIVVALRAGS
jgi:hypothetical protein